MGRSDGLVDSAFSFGPGDPPRSVCYIKYRRPTNRLLTLWNKPMDHPDEMLIMMLYMYETH